MDNIVVYVVAGEKTIFRQMGTQWPQIIDDTKSLLQAKYQLEEAIKQFDGLLHYLATAKSTEDLPYRLTSTVTP